MTRAAARANRREPPRQFGFSHPTTYWLGAPGQSALTYPDLTRDPSISQAQLVLQVQEGRHRIVAPDIYADSTLRTDFANL